MIWVDNEKWLYESTEEALHEYWEDSIRNKDELLAEIDHIKEEWEEKSKSDSSHSVGYYRVLLSLIDRFKERVRKARLFDAQEYWGYNILINCEGVTLSIECTDNCMSSSDYEDEYPESLDPDGIGYSTSASYDLIREEARQLTVDEYASIYDVDSVTVRQWIRRGKIRCAVKKGNEWRIPELYDLPKRGYTSASYLIMDQLTDLPFEFSCLNDYASIHINQDVTDKKQYRVTLEAVDETTKELILGKNEKEKLELLLIASPQVKWVEPSALAYFTKRH